jgi:site-specific DNA-methyltransferase (adenine-specific)
MENFEELFNMKFDVIVGNPPYQLEDGGAGGKGLNEFREKMLHDSRIRKLVDYFDPNECFPGIDLSGGVCYFLWDRDNMGNCEVETVRIGQISKMQRPLLEDGSDTFIRFNEAINIVHKINKQNELPRPEGRGILFALQTRRSSICKEII